MPSDAPHTAFQGRYSDGRSAAAHGATITLANEGLVVDGAEAGHVVWPYAMLQSAVPLSAGARETLLKHEQQLGSLFVEDPAFVAGLLARAPHLRPSSQRWRIVKLLLPLPIAAATIYVVIQIFDLHPTQAIARMLPESTRAAIGRQAIAQLGGNRRTCETPESRAALDRLVDRLAKAGIPDRPTVRILDWGLENAFAVPGRQVVLTRAIIQKAASPDEVAGVLAHEIGHTTELHPEAGLVRGIGLMAGAQLLFTGQPGALGNIGIVLAQMNYTRGAEREADGHAIRMLKGSGIAIKGLIDFFERLGAGRSTTTPPAGPEKSEKRITTQPFDLFRSHPATAERLARLKQEPTYPATPALEAADWQALRTACGPLPSPAPAR
jgi:beta-barrel assembly-enhancing protease